MISPQSISEEQFFDNLYSIESWENRYTRKLVQFDWLLGYDELEEDLKSVIRVAANGKAPTDLKILNIGCGTSDITEKIYTELGIKQITNIDSSSILINHLQKEKFCFEGMKYVVKDAITSDITEGGPFDLIIDKFTSDTFLALDQCNEKMITYFRNVFLALSLGGIYLIISGNENRQNLLVQSNLPFKIDQKKIENNFTYEENKNGKDYKEDLSMAIYLYSCNKIDDNFNNEYLEKFLNYTRKFYYPPEES